jgi:serine/threonine-protein kinase
LADLRDQLQATLGGSYTLEQELGGGGMSRVFVAQEAALGRRVVVKVLPQEMTGAVSLDRFRREIQLAAQLQHPHIVPLLTAGETEGLPFFTMPYVRGESLRARLAKGGELPVADSIRILREVASALAYAHENNVVHRDIKPENVLISGGSAVVTDFGVAKALTASSGAGGSSLTSMGVALGTPAYMAPEQATADPNTDHRADIYALGVMAYELLTGSTPFQGRSPQATLAAHVTEKPEPVSQRRATIPPLLASLVMSCLEKRPADRPQTAEEVMHQLDALHTPSGGLPPTMQLPAAPRSAGGLSKIWWGVAGLAAVAAIVAAGVLIGRSSSGSKAAAETPVIAVIPFENVGREEGREFTDGITEEITSRLSSVSGLRVIGRQTSRGYANTTKTPQQIAAELGVNYLLTGTVRWDRSSEGKEVVRVSPALVRTSDATQVWAQPYQTVLSGIFEVQSKVANEVASALNIALLAPERSALAARPTENMEAYGFYLRGVELIRNSTQVRDLRAAIESLQKAVELDPRFAAAHAWLAIGHTELYWFRGDRTEERVNLARASADRALELDPSATSHLALGIFHYHAKLDYDAALKELAIAERMRPNDFEAVFYAAAIQRRQGKWEESIANMNRAIEIEPRVGLNISDMASTLVVLRRYDEAERASDRALIVTPGERDALGHKATIAIARDGDVAASVRYLRQRFDIEARRDIAAATVLSGLWPAMTDPVMRQAMIDLQWFPDAGDRALFLGNKAAFYYLDGNTARARAYADSAAILLRNRLKDRADDSQYFIALSGVEAVRGNREEARRAIDRAVELQPVSRDAYGGAEVLGSRAVTLVLIGDYDGALTQLEQLLSMPSFASRNSIRLSPVFSPLRGNPRFQRMVAAR